MIAKLAGVIDSLSESSAIVDVGGVGYLVQASGRTLASLHQGQAASLLVETHLREDGIYLYGFRDRLERGWFRLLTQVQGVGPKVALSMLTVFSSDDLTHAIVASDAAALKRAPGVGAKLAARIVVELKDKIGAVDLGVVHPLAAREGETGDRRLHEAVSALVNLGYGAGEAMAAVARAARGQAANAKVEVLIRGGLKELARAPAGEAVG
ncbi:MAG: Holliday junction branch migration protein RuvA [Rhodospirillales bacterium]|nr:Holliday junction branch migration protein RuvA [Rhodospirillales bacterium]